MHPYLAHGRKGYLLDTLQVQSILKPVEHTRRMWFTEIYTAKGGRNDFGSDEFNAGMSCWVCSPINF
jgi:hypothetical protein